MARENCPHFGTTIQVFNTWIVCLQTNPYCIFINIYKDFLNWLKKTILSGKPGVFRHCRVQTRMFGSYCVYRPLGKDYRRMGNQIKIAKKRKMRVGGTVGRRGDRRQDKVKN